MIARRLAIAATASALVACGIVAGIDDLRIGDCKGGQCERDATVVIEQPPGQEASAPIDSGTPCTGTQPPTPIRVGSGDNTFCIDTTEVTNLQYRAFMTANPSTASQPAVCVWNTDYTPALAGATPDDAPVTNVDWCDALAYCTWAGKYLCGRVESGHKTGPVTDDGLSDYQSHQWMLACSAQARLRYPYGGTFDPSKCNLRDLDAGGVVPVASLPGCEGGYEGLHDMIGNAWEWFDSPCNPDGGLGDGGEGNASDSCIIKGGAYDNSGAAYDCRFDLDGVRRDFHGPNVGFRCCSD